MKATTTLMMAFLALSGVALAQPYVVVGTITYHDIFIGAFGLQPNTAYTVSLFNSAGSLVNSPYSVTTNATGALQGASGDGGCGGGVCIVVTGIVVVAVEVLFFSSALL